MRFARLLPACVACVGLTAVADDADLFKQLDSSGDGVVEKSEVGEERVRFFDRLLRVGDTNEDGKLSEAEFNAALSDKPPEATAGGQRGAFGSRGGDRRGPGAGGREMPAPAEIVERLDTNGDGKIQRDELTGRAEMLGRVMDRLDTDELTVEQLEETRERMREMMGQGGRPEMGRPPEGRGRPGGDREMAERGDYRPRGNFRPEGGDGDFRPRGPEMARREGGPRDGERPHHHHEPPAFVKMLDENRDGKITKLEAVRLIEKFSELDKNDDGSLDLPELLGDRPQGPPMFGRMDGDRRPGPPEGRRPGGDRPRGERPEGDRPEMERRPGGEGRGFGGPGGRGGDPGAFFDRLDADKSGGLSKDEMPGFLAERFDMIDKNGDGEVTKDEMQRLGQGRGFRGGPDGFRGRPERDGDRPRRPEAEDAA